MVKNSNIIKIQVGKTTEVNIFEHEFKNGKDKIHGTICIGSYLFIRIVMRKGKNGWFISYPSYKDKNGDYKDLVFATKAFNETIIKKFEENLKAYEAPTTYDFETAEELPF
jgi:DNA-binding cell septation regulator SpoVG